MMNDAVWKENASDMVRGRQWEAVSWGPMRSRQLPVHPQLSNHSELQLESRHLVLTMAGSPEGLEIRRVRASEGKSVWFRTQTRIPSGSRYYNHKLDSRPSCRWFIPLVVMYEHGEGLNPNRIYCSPSSSSTAGSSSLYLLDNCWPLYAGVA